MTYAFTHMGNFLLLLFLAVEIGVLGLRFGPGGWDVGLEAGIWAWRLEFGPRDWDLRGGGYMEEEGGEGGGGENSPYV